MGGPRGPCRLACAEGGPGVGSPRRAMADSKQDVLDMLTELGELTMLEEGDPQSFRVRAYESAAPRRRRPGHRPRQADGQGAAEDRGHRQEHRRQDPRAARDRQGGQAGGPAAAPPARGGGPAAHPRAGAQDAQPPAGRSGGAVARRPARRPGRPQAARPQGLRREVGGEAEPGPGPHARSTGPWTARRSRWPCRWRTQVVDQLAALPGVSHASYCGSLRRFSETIGRRRHRGGGGGARAGDGRAGRA